MKTKKTKKGHNRKKLLSVSLDCLPVLWVSSECWGVM